MSRPEDRFSNTVEDAGRYEAWRSQDDYDRDDRYDGYSPDDDGAPSETDSCECGACRWVDSGYGRNKTWECEKCGTGPAVETFCRRREHRARKDHGSGIKVGDRYVETVRGGYYPGGARWLTTSKRKLAAPLIQGVKVTVGA